MMKRSQRVARVVAGQVESRRRSVFGFGEAEVANAAVAAYYAPFNWDDSDYRDAILTAANLNRFSPSEKPGNDVIELEYHRAWGKRKIVYIAHFRARPARKLPAVVDEIF